MNPKSFPKRLDSKTSSLRITVPENLDLALEGLIRNVLREQPKTDNIYSFAANYFETLLSIRDRTGAKFAETQLCPFHNDEEAREMIVLAGTMSKKLPERPQHKGQMSMPLKTKSLGRKKDTEKGLKTSEETLEDAKPEKMQRRKEKKQPTPDLIKKLPLSAQGQAEGEKVGEVEAGDEGPGSERSEVEGGSEGEFLTSDPIKEFVEKELLTEGNSKEKQNEGKGPEPSDKPIASKGQKETEVGAEVGAPPSGDQRNVADTDEKLGGDEVFDRLTLAQRQIDLSTGGTGEKEVKNVAEDKTGEAPVTQPESDGGRHLQEMPQKEKIEGEFRTEEKCQDKIQSGTTFETGAEGVEAPLPPLPKGTEKDSLEYDQEASNLEDGIRETGAKISSLLRKENAVVLGAQEAAEDEIQADAQPSVAPPMNPVEEAPETSLVTKPIQNGDARAEEIVNDQRHKIDEKKATNSAAKVGGEDLETEDASRGRERDVNQSEAAGSPDRAEVVREKNENGSSFQEEGLLREKSADSNEEGEIQDTQAEGQKKPDEKAAEERKELTSVIEGQENTPEPPKTKLENTIGVLDTTDEPQGQVTQPSEKFDRVQKKDEFERSELAAEPEGSDDYGKAAEEKLPDEVMKAKGENLTEDPESPTGQRSTEETHPGGEAPTEKAIASEGDKTPPNEEVKSEEQGNAKQDVPGEARSSSEHEEMPESARPKELKDEDIPIAVNEFPVEEELCTVVDINHIPEKAAMGSGNPELEPAEPGSKHPVDEKSVVESEDLPSPSIVASEETNEKPTEMHTQTAERKEGSHEVPFGPGTPEIDKEAAVLEEGAISQPRGPQEPEGFGPPSGGTNIVIVEEPEVINERVEAGEAIPPGEIQIKTIQTHYYDALRVPETVTREYRVHGMAASAMGGLLSVAELTSPGHDNQKRSLGPGDESADLPPPKDLSPHADVAETHRPLESDALEPTGNPPDVSASVPLAADELDKDDQVSDSKSPPTSDFSSNLPELSLQKASEIFLNHEKRFSSLEKEEIRFVTPGKGKTADGPEDIIESSGEVNEVSAETALPLTTETRSAPQHPKTLKEFGQSTEGTEEIKKSEDHPTESSEGSPDPSRRRPRFLTVSGTPGQGEDENDRNGPPQAEEVKQENASDVQDHLEQTTSDDGEEKEPFTSYVKTPEKKLSESHREEVQGRSPCDGRSAKGAQSAEQTATREDSSGETNSATSDSTRRDFASARSLSTTRSLDLGKRNPLLRTRSLSTHRLGVADFEVWSTIEKELEEAATIIQSKFRGYKTRKKLRREVAVQISTEESSPRSPLVEADEGDEHRRATGEFHDGIVLSEHPR